MQATIQYVSQLKAYTLDEWGPGEAAPDNLALRPSGSSARTINAACLDQSICRTHSGDCRAPDSTRGQDISGHAFFSTSLRNLAGLAAGCSEPLNQLS